ncbi:hypothetical protein B7463_g12310, partial [Scytalidium lignicola]
MDNHNNYISPDFTLLAKKNNIIPFTFPAYFIHCIQPLDATAAKEEKECKEAEKETKKEVKILQKIANQEKKEQKAAWVAWCKKEKLRKKALKELKGVLSLPELYKEYTPPPFPEPRKEVPGLEPPNTSLNTQFGPSEEVNILPQGKETIQGAIPVQVRTSFGVTRKEEEEEEEEEYISLNIGGDDDYESTDSESSDSINSIQNLEKATRGNFEDEELIEDVSNQRQRSRQEEYLLQRHGRIDLIPVPSADPSDPLNWPDWKAFFISPGIAMGQAVVAETFFSHQRAQKMLNLGQFVTYLFFGPETLYDRSLSTSTNLPTTDDKYAAFLNQYIRLRRIINIPLTSNDFLLPLRLLSDPRFPLAVAGDVVFFVTLAEAKPLHWVISPIVGIAIAGFGTQIITTVVITYCSDCHPKIKSSVIGVAINVVRCTWGFIGPFWFPYMIDSCGLRGTAGLVAGIMILSAIPIVYLQWKTGFQNGEDEGAT